MLLALILMMGLCIDKTRGATDSPTPCPPTPPASVCGNGIVEIGETCDDHGPCCDTSVCQYRSNSFVCNAAANFCIFDSVCSGNSSSCPVFAPKPQTTLCQTAGNECQLDAFCPGDGGICPINPPKPQTTLCKTAGNECQLDAFCPGNGGGCPLNTPKNSTTLCKTAGNECQLDAFCPGNGGGCPLNTPKPQTTLCKTAGNECQLDAFCPGNGGGCPINPPKPQTTLCRTAGNQCQLDAFCPGNGGGCPTNPVKLDGTPCLNGLGACTAPATCLNGFCPFPVTTPCPSTSTCGNGITDAGEDCDGQICCTSSCTYAPTSVICDSPFSDCQNPAFCTGNTSSCPAKTLKSSLTICDPTTSSCRTSGFCSETSGSCSSQLPKSFSIICDPTISSCRTSGFCTGPSGSCSSQLPKSSSTICDPTTSSCRTSGFCSGTSGSCSSQLPKSFSIICDPTISRCRTSGFCTGPSGSCSSQLPKSSSTICNPTTSSCRTSGFCAGTTSSCPSSQPLKPLGTICMATDQPCEEDAVCDGVSSSCLSPGISTAGKICRAGSDLCEEPERCDGSSRDCPIQTTSVVTDTARVCRPSTNPCDPPETCNGVCLSCPADTFATCAPTDAPTTSAPTEAPTSSPTESPTPSPTPSPTLEPTTRAPTQSPTPAPTQAPTESPTPAPTFNGVCRASDDTPCGEIGACPQFLQVSAGGLHTCAIEMGTNKLFCWGRATFGQLGNGATSPNQGTPQEVIGGRVYTQVSTGQSHTCAIEMGTNKLFCWGRASEGQLGNGAISPNQVTPQEVIGNRTYTQVSAGAEHTCAIEMGTNRLFCWGTATSGQLGNNATSPNQVIPQEVVENRTYTQVDTGGAHTCAIEMGTNKLFCWGRASQGQLGNGVIFPDQATPQEIVGGRNYSQVEAGSFHTCAIEMGTNKLFCWGRALEGQLGNNATSPFILSIPEEVVGSRTYTQVDTGPFHTCAIEMGTNKLFCWGTATSGQLGNGATSPNQATPQEVVGGRTYSQVEAGSFHTCAIEMGTNKLFCWGQANAGQLGDGAFQGLETIPKQVVPSSRTSCNAECVCPPGQIGEPNSCPTTCGCDLNGDCKCIPTQGQGCNCVNTQAPTQAPTPAQVCGNGVVEGSEQCDPGLDTGDDCCDSTCNFVSGGSVCRPATGPCDVAETCRGDSGDCPTDDFKPEGHPCSNDMFCDGKERCNAQGSCQPAQNPCLFGTTCDEGQDRCICGAGCLADTNVTSVYNQNTNQITYFFKKGATQPGQTASCGVSHFILNLPPCIAIQDIHVSGCVESDDRRSAVSRQLRKRDGGVDNNFGPCGYSPFPDISSPLKIDLKCDDDDDDKRKRGPSLKSQVVSTRTGDTCEPCAVTIDIPPGATVGGPGPIGLKGGLHCSQCAVQHSLTCLPPTPAPPPTPVTLPPTPSPTPPTIPCGDGCLAGTLTTTTYTGPNQITYTFQKGAGQGKCDMSHFVVQLPHCVDIRDVTIDGCVESFSVDDSYGPCGPGVFTGITSPLKIDLKPRGECPGGVLSVRVTIAHTQVSLASTPIGLKGGRECSLCSVHHTFVCDSCHKDPPAEDECCVGYANPPLCQDEDKCHGVHCKNGGTCTGSSGVCACVDDWTGPRCERRDCGPNGIYSQRKDECLCKRGWMGAKCDTCMSAGPGQTYLCIPWASGIHLLFRVPNNVVQKQINRGAFHPDTLHAGTQYDCGCNPHSGKRIELDSVESTLFDSYLDECIQTSNLTMLEKDVVNEFWDDCVVANGDNTSVVWLWLAVIFILISIGLTIALICCMCTRRRRTPSSSSRSSKKIGKVTKRA